MSVTRAPSPSGGSRGRAPGGRRAGATTAHEFPRSHPHRALQLHRTRGRGARGHAAARARCDHAPPALVVRPAPCGLPPAACPCGLPLRLVASGLPPPPPCASAHNQRWSCIDTHGRRGRLSRRAPYARARPRRKPNGCTIGGGEPSRLPPLVHIERRVVHIDPPRCPRDRPQPASAPGHRSQHVAVLAARRPLHLVFSTLTDPPARRIVRGHRIDPSRPLSHTHRAREAAPERPRTAHRPADNARRRSCAQTGCDGCRR